MRLYSGMLDRRLIRVYVSKVLGDQWLPSMGNPIDEGCEVGLRLLVVQQRHVEGLDGVIEHSRGDVW
jgi:hypothetical protein